MAGQERPAADAALAAPSNPAQETQLLFVLAGAGRLAAGVASSVPSTAAQETQLLLVLARAGRLAADVALSAHSIAAQETQLLLVLVGETQQLLALAGAVPAYFEAAAPGHRTKGHCGTALTSQAHHDSANQPAQEEACFPQQVYTLPQLWNPARASGTDRPAA